MDKKTANLWAANALRHLEGVDVKADISKKLADSIASAITIAYKNGKAHKLKIKLSTFEETEKDDDLKPSRGFCE